MFKKSYSMNTLMSLNKKQILRHIVAWALIITYFSIIDPVQGEIAAKIIGSALIFINYMFVYYSLGLFIFPRFWPFKKFRVFIYLVICFLIFWAVDYINFFKVFQILGGVNYFAADPSYRLFLESLLFFTIIGTCALAFYLNRFNIYKLKLQNEKEKSLIVKELNFLKNQFNSHITFNFLNYCYSKIHQHSPETAESIELFSDMLRYTLQTKPEEKVTLSSEIIYIENFISLQKRLSTKVYVNFHCEGEMEHSYILPRILITFIENSFKHGLYNNPQYPIHINLNSDGNKLVFTVKNKNNQNKGIINSNTGLENVTQILDLYYSNNYMLNLEEIEGFFKVELIMNL
jgi:hypothetical protein